MIPRKKKICRDCEKERYIFSHGRCKACSSSSSVIIKKSRGIGFTEVNGFSAPAGYKTDPDKLPKWLSKPPKKQQALSRGNRKVTGEAEMFKEIWSEREHRCTNCKCHLGDEAKAFFFAHILPKGRHPELRLVKTNVMICCFDCHQQYDQGTKEGYAKRFNLYLTQNEIRNL